MRVSIRRTLRVGERAGTPVEDLGVVPTERHHTTRDDVLAGNVDLLDRTGALLAGMPVQSLRVSATFDGDGRLTVECTVGSVDRVGVYVDGRPRASLDAASGATSVTLEGLDGAQVVRCEGLQRRETRRGTDGGSTGVGGSRPPGEARSRRPRQRLWSSHPFRPCREWAPAALDPRSESSQNPVGRGRGRDLHDFVPCCRRPGATVGSRPAGRKQRFQTLGVGFEAPAEDASRPSTSIRTMEASPPPKPTIGGPTSAAWREEILARAEALRFLEEWIRAHEPALDDFSGRFESIRRHLDAAQVAAGGEPGIGRLRRRWNRFTRSSFERSLANLDMAEIDLLRLSPVVLEGALPSIRAHVNRFLAKNDPRREELDRLSSERHEARERLSRKPLGTRQRLGGGHHEAQRGLSPSQREVLLHALFAANTQRRRNLARVRSFRNMLRGGTFAALVLAVALAGIGLAWPQAIPLCFTPETGGTVTLVCPQAVQGLGSAALLQDRDVTGEIAETVRPSDILLVEFVGLLGAVLSVTALLRNIKRGTATPYNVPFLLAVLKVPTGALTAVAGILLMRADFVPGLSALDSPAQILGWALVFGIAQQLVTRVADDRASTLLEDVGGRGAGGDRPLKTPPQA